MNITKRQETRRKKFQLDSLTAHEASSVVNHIVKHSILSKDWTFGHACVKFKELLGCAHVSSSKRYLHFLDSVSIVVNPRYRFLSEANFQMKRAVTTTRVLSFLEQPFFKNMKQYAEQYIHIASEKHDTTDIETKTIIALQALQYATNTVLQKPGIQFDMNNPGYVTKVGQFEYRQFSNCGREYEVCGIASMSEKARNILMSMFNKPAVDIDMVSAAPTILTHIINTKSTSSNSSLLVEIRSLLNDKKNGDVTAKNKLNHTMFGSTEHLHDKRCRVLYHEAKKFAETYLDCSTDRWGRVLARHIFTIENTLQREFESQLSQKGVNVISHIYDGCITEETTQALIDECAAIVADKHGVQMKWTIKNKWNC